MPEKTPTTFESWATEHDFDMAKRGDGRFANPLTADAAWVWEEARKAALEEVIAIASQDSMLDWRGGSTGSAKGTAMRIAAAIRALGEGEGGKTR